MLTILLKLLSILGILLLTLLGVALVIILLILFFPVTYKAFGKKTSEDMQITAKANWLLGFFRIAYSYPEPGKLLVKCLFFTVYDSSAEKKNSSQKKKKKKKENASEKQESAEQNVAKQSEKAQQSTDKMMAEPKNPVQCEDSPHEQKVTEDKGTGEEANQQEHFEIPEENNGRLQQLFDKIRYTVKKICAKIKNILQNLSFYRELWKDPDTQGLLQHAGKRFGFIIKRLRPRKLQINAVIGTGSPDTTGYLYGIYGMLLSWLGKGINITPDFEQAVLEGDFQTAGHFTIGCVLFHSVRLLLDKRLRQLLDKIKQFKKIQKKAS